ncbi:Coiled-coil domain-containing protein 57, partial [Bienertia sinuspersici]
MHDVFMSRPHWPANDIIKTIKRAYKVLITRTFAYKVKYYSYKLLHDGMQDHYFKLGRYMAALKGSSEGTTAEFMTDGGQLLAAIGRDANKQMFPITWAAVEGERICLGSGSLYTFKLSCILEMAQAVLNAVSTVLPKLEHIHYYNDALAELEELNANATLAFIAHNPKCFCRAFMDTSIKRYAITNNMRLLNKRKEMEKHKNRLCPRTQSILEKEKEKASMCDVLPSSEHILNVRYYLYQLIVNLELKTCTCKKWDTMGIPRCHALSCIFFLNHEVEAYVDDYYKTKVYFNSYARYIPSMEGERHWPKVEIKVDPPPIKLGLNRLRKSRIKDPFEEPKKPGTLLRHGMGMIYTLCKAKGHNKRGCPQKRVVKPSEPPPKKPRGRPRKESPSAEPQPSQRKATRKGGGRTNAGKGGGIGHSGGGSSSREFGGGGSGGRESDGRGTFMRGRGASRVHRRNQVKEVNALAYGPGVTFYTNSHETHGGQGGESEDDNEVLLSDDDFEHKADDDLLNDVGDEFEDSSENEAEGEEGNEEDAKGNLHLQDDEELVNSDDEVVSVIGLDVEGPEYHLFNLNR